MVTMYSGHYSEEGQKCYQLVVVYAVVAWPTPATYAEIMRFEQ